MLTNTNFYDSSKIFLFLQGTPDFFKAYQSNQIHLLQVLTGSSPKIFVVAKSNGYSRLFHGSSTPSIAYQILHEPIHKILSGGFDRAIFEEGSAFAYSPQSKSSW
jgi:hypothetical protein